MTREEKIAEIRRLRALKDSQPQQVQTDDSQAPSQTESAIRGLAQGALLGGADELTGVAEAAVNPSTYTGDALENYRKSRDESRVAYKKAEEANPKTYMAGNVGGALATALIPAAGVTKGAATLAELIGSGAKIGAVAGLNESNADLTQGEVGKALKDTAVGAGTGAVASGVIGGLAKGGGDALDYLKKKEIGQDFGDIFNAYRAGESLTGENVLHNINNKSQDIAEKVIQDAQSRKSAIGNEYQNFFRNTPLDNANATRDALRVIKDEVVNNSSNPVIREQRNGLIKYLESELSNPNIDGRKLQQIKDELENISSDAFKGSNEQFMSRFNDLTEQANPNYFKKLEPINQKYTDFMELLGGLKSSTGENFSTALNKDAAAKEGLTQAFSKANDIGGQTYNKLNRLSQQSNVLSNSMPEIQDLARKKELNQALSEGGFKGHTLDAAPVLGTAMNKLDTAMKYLGADTKIGQWIGDKLSSPDKANKAYFLLNQQPWFRNIVKSNSDTGNGE